MPTSSEIAKMLLAPEPEDQGPKDQAPWRPFPIGELPDPIASYIVDGAAAIRCDPVMVALPMLSTLATIIGTTRQLRLSFDWPEFSIIWTATIAESGTAKTPAQKLALAPLQKLQARAFKRFDEIREQYERARLQYEVDLATWKGRAKKGDAGDPPKEPAAPAAVRYIVNDTTLEALCPILSANPRGVLVQVDELPGWLGGHDRYHGGHGSDVSAWLSMHSAATVTIDRKSGDLRTIHIPRAAASITGGIQPGIFRKTMTPENRARGLLARLLLAYPPRRPKRWSSARVSVFTKQAVELVFERLAELAHVPNEDDEPMPVDVGLSPEAGAIWARFVNEHGDEAMTMTGDLAAAWSKLEAYAARLGLIIHLTRWAADDVSADPTTVDAASLNVGIALARWFGSEARLIYATFFGEEADPAGARLLATIQRNGGTITAREILRSSRQFATLDDAEKALVELAMAGVGKWVDDSPDGPGRPTRRFILGGGVDGNGQNLKEKCNCVNVNALSESETGGGPVDESSPSPTEDEAKSTVAEVSKQ